MKLERMYDVIYIFTVKTILKLKSKGWMFQGTNYTFRPAYYVSEHYISFLFLEHLSGGVVSALDSQDEGWGV